MTVNADVSCNCVDPDPGGGGGEEVLVFMGGGTTVPVLEVIVDKPVLEMVVITPVSEGETVIGLVLDVTTPVWVAETVVKCSVTVEPLLLLTMLVLVVGNDR